MPRRKPTHGGAREGAGRPLERGVCAVSASLRLYPDTWARLAALAWRHGKTRREVVEALVWLGEKRGIREALETLADEDA
jgi:hypothetical protein